MDGNSYAAKKLEFQIGKNDNEILQAAAEREIGCLKSFDHPLVINILDLVKDKFDHPCIIMEMYDSSLNNKIK
jgi:hypothetical protein